MGNSANVLVGVAVLSIRYPVGGAWREIGYTEDGVTMAYNVTKTEIRVEEETYPIAQALESEDIKITANLAESALQDLHVAMAGATLAGSTLSFGGGTDKVLSVSLVGTNPSGFARTITIPLAVASGSVSMSYRRNEKTIVPVEFTALKGVGDLCTIVDATA